jgi:predicted Ser/Thr protein kinase
MRSLGRYLLMDEIGRGSMGTVFRASDPLIERTVAIKTVDLGRLDDGSLEPRLRFLREAKAAGRLSHPGIVTVHDVGELEDVAFIVMEHVEGRSLKNVLDRGDKVPLAAALEIVRQAADALAYAHKNGVVHRDVKPGNLMLTRDGRVKLTDFGIARVDQGARTRTGILVGSPRYMSPEQLSAKQVDGRSDVFSLGSLLYELATGIGPFDAERPEDVLTLMQNITGVQQVPPRRINRDIPPSVETIIQRALAKDPDARYATADEMAATLATALERDFPQPRPIGDIAKLAQPPDQLLPEFDIFGDSGMPPQRAAQAGGAVPPAGATRTGLLARLRRQAEAMEGAIGPDDATTEILMRRFEVERRMRAAFAFYQELVRYLGIVKPDIGYDYSLEGFGTFARPRVADAFVDQRQRRHDGRPWTDMVLLTVVGVSSTTLRAECTRAQLQPVIDRIGNAALRYTTEDLPDGSGRSTVSVLGEITAYVRVMADRERGRIAFLCRNVGQFGASNFVIDARAPDESVFEEFANYVLGQPNRFLALAGRT